MPEIAGRSLSPEPTPSDERVRSPAVVRFMEQIIERRIATGVSSRAMANAVLGLRTDYSESIEQAMPYDMGDWGRCLRTYRAAPEELREQMRPIMDRYAERLRAYHAKHGGDWRINGLVWPEEAS